MQPAAEITPDYVDHRFDRAGATLLALRGRGVFPTGFRSSMPDYVSLPAGADALPPQLAVPGPRAISDMEEVYFAWVSLLPWRTDLERRDRRILLLRSLFNPLLERKDQHVWTWRALGDLFGLSHHTVIAHHDRTIDRLTARLRRLPEPCAVTLARIARAGGPDHEIAQTRNRLPISTLIAA